MTSHEPILLESDEDDGNLLIIEPASTNKTPETKKSRKLSIDSDDIQILDQEPVKKPKTIDTTDLDTQVSSESENDNEVDKETKVEANPKEVASEKIDDKTPSGDEGDKHIPTSSPIRLLTCDSFNDTANKDTVSLEDLIGSPDLTKTYQFNMMINFEFLSEFIKADPNKVEVFLINSHSKDPNDTRLIIDDKSKATFKHLQTINVTMQDNYASHHSKMMINFFNDDTMQMVIHTMNLTPADYRAQTQMAWISPRLPLLPEGKDEFKEFKAALQDYLSRYSLDAIQKLNSLVNRYDFSSVQGEFVGCAPGDHYYDMTQPETRINDDIEYDILCRNRGVQYGYGRIYQLFQRFHLGYTRSDRKTKVIAQVSSIAAPYDGNKNIFLNLLLPIMVGSSAWPLSSYSPKDFGSFHKVDPVILWPTVNEVRNALYSHISGHALHFDVSSQGYYTAKKVQGKNLAPYFHRWGNPSANPMNKSYRSLLSPHCKTYCATDDNFDTLRWFLLTSANLSKQAWGYPNPKEKGDYYPYHNYRGMSYEVGILLHPLSFTENEKEDATGVKLIPVVGRDTLHPSRKVSGDYVPIRLPYDLPLRRYSDKETPWTKHTLERLVNTEPIFNPALNDILKDA